MGENRLRRINIPTPNADLAKWLMGPECRAEVERVTTEIYSYYVNSLPVRTGNLKTHAGYYIEHGGWGAERDRWFGWVTNDALSYRKTRGQPYPRVVEYGNRRLNIPAGRHLRRAAELVAGEIGSGRMEVAGVVYDPTGRGSNLRSKTSGRFVANPLAKDKTK